MVLNLWQSIDQEATLAQTRRMLANDFTAPNWNAAWQEHFNLLECNDEAKPSYVGRSSIHRFQGQYIQALVPNFEQIFREHFREWLFRTFLSDVVGLYEFGSGSAEHLLAYCKQYSTKFVMALDYAPAALKCAERWNLNARQFDLTQPDYSLDFLPDAGVLTFDALEQIKDPRPFIEFLRAKKPKRVVHVEPIVEWYGESPFDRLAREYHLKRGYMQGLPACLPNVVYQCRTGFGSRFHEGYSVTVWNP